MRIKSIYSLLAITLTGLTLGACRSETDTAASGDEAAGKAKVSEVRIGLQKSGSLVYLRDVRYLEDVWAKQGIQVKWVEFPSGPPMLEALNTGNLDLGTVGDSPPIFAQAAGAKLMYVANELPSPKAEAIIVPANSPIRSVSELKGKAVAVTKGSSANYTLLKALERDKLTFDDIKPKYLQPADARAAFETGQVAAWAIWEPYLSSVKIELNARVLTDGEGLKPNTGFYLASKDFAQAHPDLVEQFVSAVGEADKAITANPEKYGKIIENITGLKPEIALSSVTARNYGVSYISADTIQAQQQVADAFYRQKLIPKPIQVKDIVWNPPQ
ncbi:aliphatic sulfonate ABC transporter substrate-binding protein [Stenoxybacter acetivorans]|uniref:aliphatic sulfonate ABC transporter substrate-binding protein n=1 Tax=Stenoxybacter acetivorans TaxID=422441 RepID=UPI00068E9CC1|nr:aliphatic sulfonate ABC transporter substrate-binding protein [Stenoxybacter acetivorans]